MTAGVGMISVFLFLADRRDISILEARELPAHEVLLWLRFYDFYSLLEESGQA